MDSLSNMINATQWTVAIEFDKQPSVNEVITIHAGGAHWEVLVGDQEWIPFSGKKSDETKTGSSCICFTDGDSPS